MDIDHVADFAGSRYEYPEEQEVAVFHSTDKASASGLVLSFFFFYSFYFTLLFVFMARSACPGLGLAQYEVPRIEPGSLWLPKLN